MGQLTLARFRGDTTFGLVARIVSTFSGGVIGMVMWCVAFPTFSSLYSLPVLQVHILRLSQRQPLRSRSSLCGVLPILFLCKAVLACSSHDKYYFVRHRSPGKWFVKGIIELY